MGLGQVWFLLQSKTVDNNLDLFGDIILLLGVVEYLRSIQFWISLLTIDNCFVVVVDVGGLFLCACWGGGWVSGSDCNVWYNMVVCFKAS